MLKTHFAGQADDTLVFLQRNYEGELIPNETLNPEEVKDGDDVLFDLDGEFIEGTIISITDKIAKIYFETMNGFDYIEKPVKEITKIKKD